MDASQIPATERKTYDIFVSYARDDDFDSSVRKFVDDLPHWVKRFTRKQIIKPYMDFREIEGGDDWERRLESDLKRSRLLLAILSPNYFGSRYCLAEWDEFFTHRRTGTTTLIIPVEFIPLSSDDGTDSSILDGLTSEQRARWEQAHQLEILNWWKVKHDEAAREGFLRNLSMLIRTRLDALGDTKDWIPNTHIINECIDEIAQKCAVRTLEKAIRDTPRAHTTTKPVCAIYTGGTVGMVREERENRDSVLTIGDVNQLRSRMPKLSELRFDIHFFSYAQPIDSSNIDSSDWKLLAEIIRDLYPLYQGFVILHGANTMAYTASALSFMFDNLTKPVVLTGAEIPLVELHSDAEPNVLNALEVAAPDAPKAPGWVPEVTILYGNLLLRGNRGTKWRSLDTSTGFFSPNAPPLGTISNDRISLDHREIRRPRERSSETLEVTRDALRDSILILDVYPDMDLRYYRVLLEQESLRGVIIKTYGTGNAPETPKDILDLLAALVARGGIVVNVTQCPQGYVELRLFETNVRLFDIGVINGGDMTVEAAYCKLKLLLATVEPDDHEGLANVRQEMQIDRRGELTHSAYHLGYSAMNGHLSANSVFRGGPRPIGHFRFDEGDIDHAYVRLQGVRFQDQEGEKKEEFRVYYNRHGVPVNERHDDSHFRLGRFTRSVDDTQVISHNLEVTDSIRRLFRPRNEGTLQVLAASGRHFNFESIELVIYTRR